MFSFLYYYIYFFFKFCVRINLNRFIDWVKCSWNHIMRVERAMLCISVFWLTVKYHSLWLFGFTDVLWSMRPCVKFTPPPRCQLPTSEMPAANPHTDTSPKPPRCQLQTPTQMPAPDPQMPAPNPPPDASSNPPDASSKTPSLPPLKFQPPGWVAVLWNNGSWGCLRA